MNEILRLVFYLSLEKILHQQVFQIRKLQNLLLDL